MLSLSEVAANLEQGTNGIWSARNVSKVSYPEQGSASCLAIDEQPDFRHLQPQGDPNTKIL